MLTLTEIEIQEQIAQLQKKTEELQKQANQIREQKRSAGVMEIVEKMGQLGITMRDLEPYFKQAHQSDSREKKALKVSKPAVTKYKGPNGDVWSGRGLTPRWLAALIESGRKKEEFYIGE